jgi:hypothetical protein
VYAVLFSSALFVIGGGSTILSAILITVGADISTEQQRLVHLATIVFFLLTALQVYRAFLAPYSILPGRCVSHVVGPGDHENLLATFRARADCDDPCVVYDFANGGYENEYQRRGSDRGHRSNV